LILNFNLFYFNLPISRLLEWPFTSELCKVIAFLFSNRFFRSIYFLPTRDLSGSRPSVGGGRKSRFQPAT